MICEIRHQPHPKNVSSQRNSVSQRKERTSVLLYAGSVALNLMLVINRRHVFSIFWRTIMSQRGRFTKYTTDAWRRARIRYKE